MLSKKLGLDQIAKHINTKRVLMRVDFNVPVKEGHIVDSTRIIGAVPSIKKILSENPKSLVLMSHLGRPNGQASVKNSLLPIVSELEYLLGTKVKFVKDCVGEEAKQVTADARNGEIILLENLRFHPEEEGKIKDANGKKIKIDGKLIETFRQDLSGHGDLFVNDAFGTAHRAHSSMVGINHKIRAAGYLLQKELENFAVALENPRKPYLVILGGAKVQDKIQLIDNLLDKVNEMIIGGGMAFTFLKKIHNLDIGNSLFDKEGYELVDKLLAKAEKNKVKLHFPVDFVCADKIDANAQTSLHTLKDGIPAGLLGLDAGPKTTAESIEAVQRANLIVWNGPQGVFELDPFKAGSVQLLEAVCSRTAVGATSIIGGGDTVSLVQKQKKADRVTHVSTGGGASLELLEGKTLPGIAHLSNVGDI